ncbi:MAG TPA: FAD-binding protein [Streptosporangiaceae bacterium]
MAGQPRNWARNIEFSAAELATPDSLAELQEVVRGAERVRALGSGHSFNRIADTGGVLVATAGAGSIMSFDPVRGVVRVSGGVRYGELARYLDSVGYALGNTASLPHISVAGSVATATHGSGDANQNLAAAVRSMELVTASGEIVLLSEGDDDFAGAVAGLGSLGIVATLELEIVPSFQVRQWVYEGLPTEAVTGSFEEIFGSAYSVSVFTDWTGGNNRIWQKVRPGGGSGSGGAEGGAAGSGGAGGGAPTWLGARLADGPRNPVPAMATDNATEQLGVPGPWHERLPHFRLEFTPSAGEELQSEYLVARDVAGPAIEALFALGDQIAPVLQIAEIRTMAADDLWLSMAYGRDTVAFHFTWVQDDAAVAPVVAAIEAALAPFGARPHWGKVFSTPPDVVRGLYPRYDDFVALLRRYDPDGKFRNDFMDRYFPVS